MSPLVPADAGLVLLPLARAAIAGRLDAEPPPAPRAAWLTEQGASFVTLTLNGALRGCIGSLIARRPLGEDVEANAVNAAFRDPRFNPLSAAELNSIIIEVSVLSTPTPLPVRSQTDLLKRLRPGVDGVILQAGWHRATFLPQVWEELPEAADFLAHLRRKAGLAPGYWGPDMRIETYTVTAWKETAPGVPNAAPTGRVPDGGAP